MIENIYQKNKDENIYKYVLNKYNVDPDSIAKSNEFDMDFTVSIYYKDACELCSPKNPVKDLC